MFSKIISPEKSGINLIIETAIHLLMEGESLYVKKHDYAPSKINARESSRFTQNENILGQITALSWISKRGFHLGVTFFGAGCHTKLIELFPTDNNTYIAKLDLTGVLASLSDVYDISQIKNRLIGENNFSTWLYWPQYPAEHKPVPVSISDTQHMSTAHEQWFHKCVPAWSGMDEWQSGHCDTQARYQGYKRSKKNGEIIYRFCVVHKGKTDLYHLIKYNDEFYLLDYLYDSVSISNPIYKIILEACKAQILK